MPAAKVTSVVEDLSTRVNSTSTFNTAIVVAAPKGPINKPVKISSQTAFLRTYTPYERIELNWDSALFEAYKYLEDQNGLYVVRAANTDKETGVKTSYTLIPLVSNEITEETTSDEEPTSTEPTEPTEDPTTPDTPSDSDDEEKVDYLSFNDFETLEGSLEGADVTLDTKEFPVIIYASSPGTFGNALKVEIVTDRASVGVDGAFILKVKVRGTVKETFTCSLSKTIKDGYGSNCYIKDVLEASQYVRAHVLIPSETSTDSKELTLTVHKSADYDVDQVLTVYTKEDKTFTGITEKSVADLINENLLSYIDVDTEELKPLTAEIKDDKIKDNRVYITDVYTNPNCTSGSEFVLLYKVGDEKEINPKKLTLEDTNKTSTLINLPKEGVYTLEKGSNGDGSQDSTADANIGQRITALKALRNMHDLTFQLILDGGHCDEAYHRAISSLTGKRKNSCHGIICTDIKDEKATDAITALANYRKYQLNMNSYSMEMYTPHQKYYDEFNDRYMWLSPGPFVAAKIMQTAQERGWHWAVAGYNRGVIDSIDVVKPFEEGEVDELSDMQINTIIKDPGSGNVIWDELTLLNQASDLQDAHISRWINIYLRPALEEMLKSFLFEFNDEETRNLIVKKIETFMEPQKSSRACYAYRVICNEQNNTDDDIENNRLNCWLYVKPTKIAKWITQKIIVTPYSTSLEDLEF